jgi:hypothetical protein
MSTIGIVLLVSTVGSTPGSEEASPQRVREVIQRSISYVEKNGHSWIERKNCVSCHRTGTMVWSLAAARENGYSVSKRLDEWYDWSVQASLAKNDKGDFVGSGNREGVAQLLLAGSLFAKTPKRVDYHRKLAEIVSKGIQPDGSWKPGGQLPLQKRPQSETTAVTTMWLALALADQDGAAQQKAELKKAVAFLKTSPRGKSTEWYAARLLLARQLGEETVVSSLAKQLRDQQQDDGGWGWVIGQPSDALGTGMSMYALLRAGLGPEEATIDRALRFLVDSQRDDGSWAVKGTKAKKQDEVVETAVYWGTTWALLALVESWKSPLARRDGPPPLHTAWTKAFDFNDGVSGEKVDSLDAAGGAKYTAEQSYEGGQAALLAARRGQENFGHWGGSIAFPAKLRQGDELWWRVRTFWPKGMDYSANPRLKFLRIHTSAADGTHRGYNDIYINPLGSKTPFQYIYEGAHEWSPVGDAKDAIVPDQWETYEIYLKLDDRSKDDGGQARVRVWKNGRLLVDITDRKTLKLADDCADRALLFTYWNSSPYVGRIEYEGGGAFRLNETVVCDEHRGAKFRVEESAPRVVYLEDPNPDWREKIRPFHLLKPGDILTGRTSGNTCSIKEVLHTHPVMDIKMYVDDIVLTCETPTGQDARGNPCLTGGMDAR